MLSSDSIRLFYFPPAHNDCFQASGVAVAPTSASSNSSSIRKRVHSNCERWIGDCGLGSIYFVCVYLFLYPRIRMLKIDVVVSLLRSTFKVLGLRQ